MNKRTDGDIDKVIADLTAERDSARSVGMLWDKERKVLQRALILEKRRRNDLSEAFGDMLEANEQVVKGMRAMLGGFREMIESARCAGHDILACADTPRVPKEEEGEDDDEGAA